MCLNMSICFILICKVYIKFTHKTCLILSDTLFRQIIIYSESKHWFKGFWVGKNSSYQMLLTESKILFLAKVIELWKLRNTFMYIAQANFSRTVFEVEVYKLVVSSFSFRTF